METDTAARYPCLGNDEPETEHELGLVVERDPTAVATDPHKLSGYQKINVSVTNSAQCSSPRTVQYCSHGFISWARRLHSAWYVLNAGYTWHVAWLHTALCMIAPRIKYPRMLVTKVGSIVQCRVNPAGLAPAGPRAGQ